MDILPTILDLLGLPVSEQADGVNLLSEQRRLVVSQHKGEFAIRDGS